MEHEARKMKTEDWEFYRQPFDTGNWIRRAGDEIFDALLKKRGEEDNAILFSESADFFFGLPYEYRTFRGITAYIARRAAKEGLCFVVSPVLKYTANTYEIVVEDLEMALIEEKEMEGAEWFINRK